jgi:hypothetical protein
VTGGVRFIVGGGSHTTEHPRMIRLTPRRRSFSAMATSGRAPLVCVLKIFFPSAKTSWNTLSD